jgi:hypothetical protein
MQWLSDAAVEVRAAVGVGRGGDLYTDHLLAVINLFPGRLALRYLDVPTAAVIHRPQGALIIMPSGLRGSGWEHDFRLAHEIGHGLFDNPLAAYLEQVAGDNAGLWKLARRIRWTNERQAHEWTAAFFGRRLLWH